MKLSEIKIGNVYEVKVSDRWVPVRIDRRADNTFSKRTYFYGTNLMTRKEVKLSAARCRRRLPSMEQIGPQSGPVTVIPHPPYKSPNRAPGPLGASASMPDPVLPKIHADYGQLKTLADQTFALARSFMRMASAARDGYGADNTQLREASISLDALKARLAGLL